MGGGGSKPPQQAPIEPIKSADDAIKQSSSASGRNQQLRRGLASAFSRSSMGGGATNTSATSGTAAKLGA